MTCTIRTTDSLTEASRWGWDGLAGPDDLIHSSSWMGFEAAQSDLPPRYHMAWVGGGDDRQADAALSCYPLSTESEAWPFTRIDAALRHVAERSQIDLDEGAASALAGLLPTYVCGARRAPDTRLLIAEQRRPGEGEPLAHCLLDHVERDACASGIRSVTLLFVRESDDALRRALEARGYLRYPSARSATLPLTRPGFDGYLAGMDHKRRNQVKRERRRLQEAGVRFGIDALGAELIAELVPLQLQQFRKYGHDPSEKALAASLALQAEHCGHAMRAVTARSPDGTLRGFATMVHWGRHLYMRQVGFDYEWQGPLPLYFGVTYYTPIEYAVQAGVRLLHYSIESEAAKVWRGCALEQRYGYLKVLAPGLQDRIEPLVRAIRP
jgi:predicted N-acyltransferase